LNHLKPKRLALVVSCILLFSATMNLFGGPEKTVQLPANERPATWASPLEKPGLPNLNQVSSVLFRGAQPTHEGMGQLEKMGVKTVVNLRGLHDNRDKLSGTKLSNVTIRFHTWHPEDEDMVKFLKTVTDTNRQPVFVHCKRGIDRTGTMVAVYRIAVQGWSKDEAVREMTQGGFGYDDMFPNLVEYVKKLDVPSLQKKAGIGLAMKEHERAR
jgi:protein tyrosine/serine phosphatase